ncbi:Lrp/AsnC family transcriptional regulator [Rhodococcus opacus]|uniref:Lrp/AsnC family transcriptional regulator n=1 Tax=Rhodococcus opacus TaxID=37919 RepID=UPI002474C338|nr:Lrp/AsnC family transcriptional regulator [Rhodococcus opacus]
MNEDDLLLINALQFSPRASFADLAAILQTSPATLARRWTRLVEEGLAWITAYPQPASMPSHVMALVEVNAPNSNLDHIAEKLAAEPRVVSIGYAARGSLNLTVLSRSLNDLSELLIGELGTAHGMTTTNHLVTRTHAEASRWRLNALSPHEIGQLRNLRAAQPESSLGVSRGLTSNTMAIADVLARNGRATASEIAEQINRPDSTVRRQLGALLRSGSLSFRCEVAQSATRWPISVTFWCRVPAADRQTLVDELAKEPRLRTCVSVAGRANFATTIWIESVNEVLRFQDWLEGVMQSGEILDTSIILASTKRMGWMLERDGRTSGKVVPYLTPSSEVGQSPPS